jgi:hypothetical protein
VERVVASEARRRLAVRPERQSRETFDIAEWVRCSCERQGVPLKVEDRQALFDVAVLMTAGREGLA